MRWPTAPTLPQGRYGTAALVLAGTATYFAVDRVLRRRRRAVAAAAAPSISTRTVSETVVRADLAATFPRSNDGGDSPSTVTELREPISEVDEWLCRASHWLQFCYRFDEVLDEKCVREGLARTLAHVPALGARVDTSCNPTQYEFVLSPDNHGVVLEVAHGTVRGSGGAARRRLALPDASSTREEWRRAGLDAPAAGFGDAPGPDAPLLRARLTVFPEEGVSYLAVGISHGLGDGRSVTGVLHMWSHFCGSASSSVEGLPPSLREPRPFGRRVTEAVKPAKDVAELEGRVESDVGCDINPLSKWAFYGRVLPRAIWTMSRQRVLELRISRERMAAVKAAVADALPEGEWVSRFEVLCAVMLVAQRATAGGASASDHDLHVACDLRGRAERFGANYFGNASFDFRRHLRLPADTSWDLPNIVEAAREVHAAVRSGLADPEDVCKTKDWFEAARHLGIRNTYDVWPIIFDTLRGTGTFVNSWDDSWWLRGISMGAKQEAAAFHAYFGVAQNLIVEVPRDRKSGDTTVHLALPPNHAKRLEKLCRQYKGDDASALPLPFSVVTAANE